MPRHPSTRQAQVVEHQAFRAPLGFADAGPEANAAQAPEERSAVPPVQRHQEMVVRFVSSLESGLFDAMVERRHNVDHRKSGLRAAGGETAKGDRHL